MWTPRWKKMGFAAAGFLLGVSSFMARAQTPAPSAETAFQQTLKPVLDRSCGGCHMSGGHAGGLEMNSFAQLIKGGSDGTVVTLGNLTASSLSRAVHYNDDTLQMPPKAKISDTDIAVIDRWIKDSSVPLATDAPVASAATPAVSGPVTATTTAKADGKAHVTAVILQSAGSPQLVAEQEEFFETSVRPVLANKCFFCHGSAAKGGLRLDSRQALLQGGKDGPVVVVGDPEHSLLSHAVHYGDSRLQMPPRAALKADEVAAIDRWIKDGLIWPASAEAPAVTKVTAEQRKFWSFQPVIRPSLPQLSSAWISNDVDRFVLAKLQEKKLVAAPDADKRTLLRRVSYDLTGLPPTPDELNAFLDDQSLEAYARVVDRLLASKAYGERWGRIWLDVVRYADTTGGGGDFPVPQVAKYRDYVIAAFNEDKPYDRFLKEQLAGDLLPSASEDEHWKQVIATGYLAGASTNDGAQVLDAVDNLGAAFLGMTVSCARCHDHKFDPVPTSDYYAVAGIFKSTHFPRAGNDGIRYQTEFVNRDPHAAERPDLVEFQAQLKPIAGAIAAVGQLPGTYDDLMPQLQRRRMNLYARAPQFPENAYAVTEGQPARAQIQLHGDATNLGSEVPRGTLQVLGGGALPVEAQGSGRLALANWIASKDNPTTARVIVNRLWQGHFGRGIVPTPNNFGTRGVAPSNQALLDFLASELVAKGWSLKAMQREILLSHTYRLSSESLAADEEIDPDAQYLWRHNASRLDAEEIRDTLLADSGLLDRTPALPHPFPSQSEWNWEEQNPFIPDLVKYETDRRTVYMMVQRSVKHPYMTLFDGADPNVSTDQRTSSLTPLQALYFMNAAFPKRCADHFAEEVEAQKKADADRLKQAFLVIYSRVPAPAERQRSEQFLARASAEFAERGDSPEAARRKAFSHLVQAMFSSNEFMFVQ